VLSAKRDSTAFTLELPADGADHANGNGA
jgi:hypothetical protein